MVMCSQTFEEEEGVWLNFLICEMGMIWRRLGEGNGNPLQCSCLENPRESGAWWAAVYGVAQSRTRLKRLSSSSNEVKKRKCPLLSHV